LSVEQSIEGLFGDKAELDVCETGGCVVVYAGAKKGIVADGGAVIDDAQQGGVGCLVLFLDAYRSIDNAKHTLAALALAKDGLARFTVDDGLVAGERTKLMGAEGSPLGGGQMVAFVTRKTILLLFSVHATHSGMMLTIAYLIPVIFAFLFILNSS